MTTKSRYVGLRITAELYEAAKARAAAQSKSTGLRVTVSDVLRISATEALKPSDKGWMVRIVTPSGKIISEHGPMSEQHATRMANNENRRLTRWRDPMTAPGISNDRAAIKVREP